MLEFIYLQDTGKRQSGDKETGYCLGIRDIIIV